MADCIAGFPHANTHGSIGGFLVDYADSAAGRLLLPNAGADMSEFNNPWGYPEIVRFAPGTLVQWEGLAAPSAGGTAYLDVDAKVNIETDPHWVVLWQYLNEADTPWLVIDGVPHTFLLLAFGEVTMWFLPVDQARDVVTMIRAFDNLGVEAELAAAPAGMTVTTGVPLEHLVDHSVRVGITRDSAGGVTFDISLSKIADPQNPVIEDLGTWTGGAFDGVTTWGGFAGTFEAPYIEEIFLPISDLIGQPRLVIVDACPLNELPFSGEPVIKAVPSPTVCSTLPGGPDSPFEEPFLTEVSIKVPIGDRPEAFYMEISSICDRPLTLSGIDWSGWLFNNSRRI